MTTTTLTNGTKIPERASRDWYSDLSVNWNLLDNHLGDTDSHLNNGLAPKATADASGNTITSTYATKTELSTLSTTVGTKANDADVVHKADAETITGAKTFSATVTSANVVPSATDTYSLGSASVQYNAIYGKSYYYNGVQWGLDQVNSWTNANKFYNHYITCYGQIGSFDIWHNQASDNLYLMSRRDSENLSGWLVNTFRVNTTQGTAQHFYGWDLLENGIRYSGLRVAMTWDTSLNDGSGGYQMILARNTGGTNPCRYFGISGLKSINGENPGALSLPKAEGGRYSLTELSSISEIGVENWVFDGRKIVIDANYVITGWLYVCIACDTDGYVVLQTGGYSYPNCFYKSTGTHIYGYASAMIPIVEGIAVTLYLRGTSLFHARYYPAAGNV